MASHHIHTAEMMMYILAVTSAKGGVGKSTIASQLAATLSMSGARTLLIDLDPQGAAGALLGLEERQDLPGVVAQLKTLKRLSPVTHPELEHLSWIGAQQSVDSLSEAPEPATLRRMLLATGALPSYVVLDLAPSLEPLTRWALREADGALVIITPDALSVRVVPPLLQHIVTECPNTRLEGLLLNRAGASGQLGAKLMATITQHFGPWLLPMHIPDDIALQEAALSGVPVTWKNPSSAAGAKLLALAEWLVTRHPSTAPRITAAPSRGTTPS